MSEALLDAIPSHAAPAAAQRDGAEGDARSTRLDQGSGHAANAASAVSRLRRPGCALDTRTLVEALLEDALLDPEVAARLLRDAELSSTERHPLVRLAERRVPNRQAGTTLDLEALCTWYAQRAGVELRRIDPLKVDFSRIGEVMSGTYASRHRILPIEVGPQHVVIATAQPFVTDWVEELQRSCRKDVRIVFSNPVDVQRYLAEFFSLARTVRGASRGNGAATLPGNFEQLFELGRSGRSLDANDQHVVSIVDWLLLYAFEQRASDIHMEPRRETGVVRFRIDGVLHNVYQVPPGVLAAMTSRLKLMGRLDVVEKRRPQDGRIKTRTAQGREVELRLSTMPTAFGEKLVMRIFDPDVLLRDFATLGMEAGTLSRWREMTARPNGIVLVTGPTGSGKTTTLYSTLRELATEEVNVSTIEDPIEIVEASFNQMQVQSSIDMGFAEGVRALMRQDPDIIMIGEIRDAQTAEMAVQAALTGHLVLSTLHTNDAVSAITRLLDLGIPAYLLNSTLIGVLAQRLVRALCRHCCSTHDGVDEAAWNSAISPFRHAPPPRMYRPVGCIECRMTGFHGRVGLYELLEHDDALRKLATARPDVDAMRRAALRAGMQPLRLSGARLVASGSTTLSEVLRSAPPALP